MPGSATGYRSTTFGTTQPDAEVGVPGQLWPPNDFWNVRAAACRAVGAAALCAAMAWLGISNLGALNASLDSLVNGNALAAPDDLTPGGEYAAPATETEILLAKIWADLLKIDPNIISATANFFELGGHSLLSVRLLSQIRAQWAVELEIRDIFAAAHGRRRR